MPQEQRTSAQLRLEYASATEDCALFRMPGRTLITLTGEDRVEWLQGQSTNDLRGLVPGNSVSFCFCSPKGQIEAIVDAAVRESDILLSADLACKQALLDRIANMVVMEDVEGMEVEGLLCLRVVGPEAASVATGIAIHNRGYSDFWVSSSEFADLQASVPTIGEPTYNIWRLEQGIPAWGKDVTEKTLPPELGPTFEAAHVSYTKGCYTGQEVLQRIHSRGHTNKTWVALVSETQLPEGRLNASVTVTSSAHSPRFGYIAGAIVRNEMAEAGRKVEVGDTWAVVQNFPLSLEP